jgi:hypothetical protein
MRCVQAFISESLWLEFGFNPRISSFSRKVIRDYPKRAHGFRLIAFCQRDGLRHDFAFGFGAHAGVSVVQFALLRTNQEITGAGSE